MDTSYIHAGWLVDGTGSTVQQDVIIHTADHIIHAIEPARTSAACRHSLRTNFSAYTLLPRLVDCHVHLFMSGTGDIAIRQRQLEAGYDELSGVISEHIARHISCGIGAVRDGGDRQGLAQRYILERPDVRRANRRTIDRDVPDDIPIRIKVAGKAWHQNGRYGKLIGRSPDPGQTLAEAIRHECSLLEHPRPDHIKIVNSGINSLLCFGKETLPQFSLDELSQAVQEAGKHHLKVMVHANGKLPVQIAVEAGCQSIEHGFFMGAENLARMRDRQTIWVPTAYTMRAYAEQLKPASREAETARRNLDHQLNQLRTARELGVPVALGSDAGSLGVHHGISLREELGILLEAGFTIPEAVRSATRIGAELLGVTDMGTLTPGMPAGWIAVLGSPSALPHSLEHIVVPVLSSDPRMKDEG
jgi:imidazolonepropionase-like amidohydrolase